MSDNFDLKQDPLSFIFQTYINDALMGKVFSKYGILSDPRQLEDYVNWALKEAKKEFYANFPEDIKNLSPEALKKIFKVKKLIRKLLREHL